MNRIALVWLYFIRYKGDNRDYKLNGRVFHIIYMYIHVCKLTYIYTYKHTYIRTTGKTKIILFLWELISIFVYTLYRQIIQKEINRNCSNCFICEKEYILGVKKKHQTNSELQSSHTYIHTYIHYKQNETKQNWKKTKTKN